jgi:hypothetical protein
MEQGIGVIQGTGAQPEGIGAFNDGFSDGFNIGSPLN